MGNRTDAGYTMADTDPPLDKPVNQSTTVPGSETRTYDANGNLTAITGRANAIVYNYRNEMIRFADTGNNQHRFRYDCFGRRLYAIMVGEGGGLTQYCYNGQQIVEERDCSQSPPVTKATYVYGVYVDEVLTMRRSGVDYHYLADDQHNVMAVTDAAGAIVERYEYGDYGQPEITTGGGDPLPRSAIDNPYMFTGRAWDWQTGLYYYRTRYLDPVAGRFTTRDTIGIWGDPNNLGNGFTYVGNNPWSLLDPYGLCKGGMTAVDWVQLGLDAAGVIPGLGMAPDLINAGISLVRGNYGDAAANVGAAVPVVGDATRAASWLGAAGIWVSKHAPGIVDTALHWGRKGLDLAGQGIDYAKNLVKNTATGLWNTGSDAVGWAGNKVRGWFGGGSVPNGGTIYRVPGEGTPSGKPYIGRHNKPDPAKTRRSPDGRDRSQAEVIDTYDANNVQEGRILEQKAIDEHGGIQNLDNKRNEIAPDKR